MQHDLLNKNLSKTVASCNRSVSVVGLKSYQHDLLNKKALIIQSPYSGKDIREVASYCWPGAGAIFLFQDVVPFALVSSCLHKGFPITSAIIEDKILHFEKEEFCNKKLCQFAIDTLKGDLGKIPNISNREKIDIVVGNQNFAHYIWNEFPVLLDISKMRIDTDIVSLFDPLELTHALSFSGHKLFAGSIKDVRGWRSRPFIFPAGTYCSASHLDKALTLLELSRESHESKRYPYVYVSIRPSGRTLVSQKPFLREILGKILSTWDNSRVLIDGFSYPEDFQRGLYNPMRKPFTERADKAERFVKDILESLPSAQRRRVTDITGNSLLIALKEISNCNYYVTHSGTLQHKIAWFFGTHGYMHGNSFETKPASVAWLAKQVEGAKVPAVPAQGTICDLEVEGMPNLKNRNRQYDFKDLDGAVQDIMGKISERFN